MTDPATLQQYESAATGAWADAEFVAATFRDTYPAPDSERVTESDRHQVSRIQTLLRVVASIIERRQDAITGGGQ